MRKMTPMILVILMLVSVLSSIDVYELQEQNEFEETSARAGADAEVTYITSPRETLYADGEATNELLAGQPINFKAYLRNNGDADLTNMQYTVTVYTAQNGVRGDVATGSTGADLAWANDKAVCSNSCQASVLAPGEYIDGGESTLKTTDGTTIVWTPESGDYMVEVKVTSQTLGDPGNDELTIPVSVKDYHDIKVDVTWLDSNGAAVNGAVEGTDDVDLKITVDLESSTLMNIRETKMAITVNNADIAGSTNLLETIGESRTVTVTDDGDIAQTTTQDTRIIIGDEEGPSLTPISGELIFTVSPPSDGIYTVDVAIESYVVFDSNDGCATAEAVCERTIAGGDAEDEFSGNNFGSVTGSATTVHDIMLSDYYLMPAVQNAPGEQENENAGDVEDVEDRYGFVGGDISESLSNGDYVVVAEVSHVSSSLTPVYDWNVTFSVTAEGFTTTYDANDCSNIEYTHTYLGVATEKTPAGVVGYACVTLSMPQGDYIVEASAHMMGQYDESTETLDEKVADMVTVNNDYSFNIEVVNFAPEILTISSSPREAVVGDTITITATAFDVEGDKVTYAFFDGTGTELACDSSTASDTQAQCVFVTDVTMVPMLQVMVVASDSFGQDDESVAIDVSVRESFTASGLADGFNAVYTITAKTSGLAVSFADGALDPVSNPDCANTPTPVGAVTVNPSTSYDSSVLEAHSITVHFPSDLGVMYMWMVTGTIVDVVGSGTADEVDASTSGYTYNFPSGSDMFPAGTTFYLIADECETPDAPTGVINQLVPEAQKGGAISVTYGYDSMLSTENVRITVCADASGCETPEVVYDRVDSDTRSVTFSSGTHATKYFFTAQICNEYACGSSVTVNATSDSEVAAVTATDITITDSGENWVVSWTPDATDDDVEGWFVCYNRGSFTASEMRVMIDANACEQVSEGNQVTIAKYTTAETVEVHFGIVPYDGVMNVAYGPSTDKILYDRAQDTSNPDDGSTTTDTEASSGVPTWTWGVIGAVVVVAFIVGAFILSRGDGDDDDKEWDY